MISSEAESSPESSIEAESSPIVRKRTSSQDPENRQQTIEQLGELTEGEPEVLGTSVVPTEQEEWVFYRAMLYNTTYGIILHGWRIIHEIGFILNFFAYETVKIGIRAL